MRQVLPIELGVAAEDRLGITGGLKAIPAAEQVLFQLLRVEIAKSGNSAHKYAPRQKNARYPPLWGTSLFLLAPGQDRGRWPVAGAPPVPVCASNSVEIILLPW